MQIVTSRFSKDLLSERVLWVVRSRSVT